MSWTASDIPSLDGKVALVTGANSGLGFQTARHLARAGAHVVLACRSHDKGLATAGKLVAESPEARVSSLELELASLASVRAAAATFADTHDRLDLLINNAGIMMTPFGKTEDGFERQIGVNHLGHFALTHGLRQVLAHTPGSRVVNVSSMAHRWGGLDLDDLFFDQGRAYSPRTSYGQSKLANLLFTRGLVKRGVTALAAHPGIAMTDLLRHFEGRWYFGMAKPFMGLFLQSAEMGALPQLRAATDPAAMTGEFYGPGGFNEQRGYPVKVGCSELARDEVLAEALWARSQELTGQVWT
ncbi:MAG: SDR family NAD(P)-dependent oxidoreductase [Proteobacteria bacterium]|nr:SDR family NAD(P)-dependent oxidoreductase [Pseudomonadota bacterium]